MYWLLAILFIGLSVFRPFPFSWLIKITPIAILLLFVTLSPTKLFPKLLKYGLAFSLLGDFILDFFEEKGFVFGLAAFFIAHIFYIICFFPWKIQSPPIPIAIATLIYGTGVVVLISPNLGPLAIPVYAYMAILFSMTLAALFSNRSNRWLAVGAISFLLSDSIIGINKFYWSFDYSDLLIMSSYYAAQYGLIKGFSGASTQATSPDNQKD
ncbi:MAG: lysoplasmalogenase [Enterobacterales bacterium]|nr:lysoplasmalogenase [Enterobacterales bacterium]